MLSSALLSAIQNTDHSGSASLLRSVADEDRRDRSAPCASASALALSNATAVDEEQTRDTFFTSGVGTWYKDIEDRTFSSTFCELTPQEAKIIVEHWQKQEAWRNSNSQSSCQDPLLFREATEKLGGLVHRLNNAVKEETAKSSVGRAFVKLATRSPKDSKMVLEMAATNYRKRIAAMTDSIDSNTKWRILSEEVANASAVEDGASGLNLLLDSARVFEDLDYLCWKRQCASCHHQTGRILHRGLCMAWAW